MNAHLYQQRREQITVKQLVARLSAEGRPTRLTWTEEQMNSQVPRELDEWPTGVIPRVVIDGAEESLGRAV
jgi:hypothetical protein